MSIGEQKWLRRKSLVLLIVLSVMLLLIPLAVAETALVAYRSNTGSCPTNPLSCPKIREWNSDGAASWGAELELASASSPVRYTVAKYSGVARKRIIVTLSDDGYLDAYVCRKGCSNPAAWVVSNDIGRVWNAAANQRRFDIEFESATGDAILVYAVAGTDPQRDLAYQVLPKAAQNFTGIAEQYLDDTSQAEDTQYTWVAIDRNPVPTSQELLLAAFDATNADANAWVWNGQQWGNTAEVSTNAIATGGGEALAVRYASDGSKGMVVAAEGTAGAVNGKFWGSGNWITVNIADLDAGDNADTRWLTLKADPATDDLQAVSVNGGSDLDTMYWNGAGWRVTANIDTTVDAAVMRPADFSWQPAGGRGVLVWDTDARGTTLSSRLCVPECITATATTAGYAGTGGWLTLFRHPTGADTDALACRLNSNFDLGAFRWQGGRFASVGDGALTADTALITFPACSLTFTGKAVQAGNVQLDLNIRERDGTEIETDVELSQARTDGWETKYSGTKRRHDGQIPAGDYHAVIKPQRHLIKEMELFNLSADDDLGELITLDDMPENAVPKLGKDKPNWVELYALRPMADFQQAMVTLTAKGNELYKCREWDFDARACAGSWQPYRNLVPGQNYTIALDADDPGYGEINITDARHLDSDYSFISNIFEQVRLRDGVWSEQIPEDHYVRATFERSLFTGNVVNIIARAQQNTESRLELYEANTTNLLASTAALAEDGQQYNTELQNLPNGSVELDIKVVNLDAAANRWVEFDWIHDAAGFPNVSYISPRNGTELVLRRAVNISANVTDDTQLSWVVTSVQMPNGTKLNITMFNSTLARNTTQQPNNFSIRFNDTSQLGTYVINVWANDTSNNLNDTATSNATIDTPNITYIAPTPSNNSGPGGGRTFLTVNTTVADGSSNTSAFFDFNRTLVAYWSMDWYNSTGVFDNSTYSAGDTNTRIGRFTGTGFGTANITAGKYGQALEFDGTNDYLEMGDILDFERTDNFSIAFWMRTAAAAPTGVMVTIAKTGTTGNIPGILLSVRGDVADDPYEWELRGTTSGEFVSIRTTRPSNTNWHHHVFTYNGSSTIAGVTIYLDGSIQSKTDNGDTLASSILNNADFQIGTREGAAQYLAGTIDEVLVFNRVITPQEINASFNAGAYRLWANFTNLRNDTYNYTACAMDATGNYNCTALQYANINTVFPNVSYINSTGGTLSPGTATNISANVTDDLLSQIFASITLPDNTVTNITMLNSTVAFNRSQQPNNFSIRFNDTSQAGAYTIRILANDTANNMNDTKTAVFRVADTVFPNVSYINTSDGFGSSVFGRKTPVNISANVTDDVQLSFIALNIQVPNGTFLPNITMFNSTLARNTTQQPNNFSIRFNDTSQTGTYILRVLANDTANNMNDTITSRFDVTSVVSITLTTSTIAFGDILISQLNDTADDVPGPFIVQNDGNVNINITVNASAIFTANSVNGSSYQFQCGTSVISPTTEATCTSPSQTTFTDMPLANITVEADKTKLALYDLMWQSTNDSLGVDIRINVPNDEPGGSKSSTVTIVAAEGAP